MYISGTDMFSFYVFVMSQETINDFSWSYEPMFLVKCGASIFHLKIGSFIFLKKMESYDRKIFIVTDAWKDMLVERVQYTGGNIVVHDINLQDFTYMGQKPFPWSFD